MSGWRDEILRRYIDDDRRDAAAFGLSQIDNETRQRAEQRFAETTARWEARVPPKMAPWTPDHLAGPAREAFDAWRAAKGRANVLILGPVGTGKTAAAFAMLRHIQFCGVWRVQWTSTVKLMERLRPGSEDPVSVDRWGRADVLLLDDLGGEKPSEWVAERLFMLMDERWQWDRPTLITSNLTPTKLRETLGDRTYSRLQDDAIAVTLTGSDRRRRSAA